MRKILISSFSGLDKSKFVEAGMIPLVVPTIRLEPNKERIEAFATAVKSGMYHSLVLLSPRSLDMIMPDEELLSKISGMKIFAIGPTTKSSIEKRGLNVSVMPAEFSSEALGALLVDYSRKDDLGSVAIVRSAFSNESLIEFLRKEGIKVDEFRIYSTMADERGIEIFLRQLEEGVDAVVFTSRSSAHPLVECSKEKGMMGRLPEMLKSTRVLCMGKETARGLEGLCVNVEVPEEKTIDGIILRLRRDFK